MGVMSSEAKGRLPRLGLSLSEGLDCISQRAPRRRPRPLPWSAPGVGDNAAAPSGLKPPGPPRPPPPAVPSW